MLPNLELSYFIEHSAMYTMTFYQFSLNKLCRQDAKYLTLQKFCSSNRDLVETNPRVEILNVYNVLL